VEKSANSILPPPALLAGRDLAPLPFESFASVVMRIAWRNLLRPRDIQRLISGRQISTNSDSFLLPKWMNSNNLLAQLGWNVPVSGELALLHDFRGLTHRFFSRQLKICPVCFGAGYHSYWHQVEQLAMCPIHHCQLTTQCVSCDASFGNYSYRFNAAVMSLRYKCSSCGLDVAGVAVSIESHLDLRHELAHSGEAFNELANWVANSKSILICLRQIEEERSPGSERFSAWCQPQKFIEGLLIKGGRRRSNLLSTLTGEITALSWKIKMQDSQNNWHMMPRHANTRRRHRACAVYSATLRILQIWIVEFLGRGNPILIIDPTDGANDTIEVDQWPSSFLAYHLMRTALESSICRQSILEPLSVTGFKFDFRLSDSLYTYQGREPRLAWRAIFLGIFASLYWTVERSRKDGKLELKSIRVSIETTVAKVLFVDAAHYICGVVFFPTIPGLPLDPYRSGTRLGVDPVHLPCEAPDTYPEGFSWPRT
jgi:hypothetical protein